MTGAQILVDLAKSVSARIISYTSAVSQVNETDWSTFDDDDVGEAINLVGRDLDDDSQRASVFSRLLMRVAEERWGESPQSPWWQIADLMIECARRSLSNVADGGLLTEAVGVARRQVAILQAVNVGQPGNGPELADTLQKLAWLIFGPYAANLDRDDPDISLTTWLDPAGMIGHRNMLLYQGERRLLPRRTVTADDIERDPMPSPVSAARAALQYLDVALRFAGGHTRGLCLTRKSVVLDYVLLVNAGESGDGDRMLAAAREAINHIDAMRTPAECLMLIELLFRHGRPEPPRRLQDFVTFPFDDLLERFPAAEVLTILTLISALTDDDVVLAALISVAEKAMERVGDGRQILKFFSKIIHSLPDNRFACAPGGVLTSADIDQWIPQIEALGMNSPRAAATTLLHLMFHAEAAEGRRAIELIGSIDGLDARFAEQHEWMIRFVRISVGRRHANAPGVPLKHALLTYYLISDDVAQLSARYELSLGATVAGDIMRRIDEGHQSNSPAMATLFVHAVSPLVRSMAPSASGQMAGVVKTYGVLLDQLMRGAGSAIGNTMLAHHFLFKGNDFGGLLDNPSHRRLGSNARQLIETIRRKETSNGPYVPAQLPDELEELGDYRPGLSTLYYATVGESAPSSEPDGSLESLRKACDREITASLLLDLAKQSGRAIDGRHPISEMERIQEALPDDTVLVSLYMGQLADTATDQIPVDQACLTVFTLTSEHEQGYVRRLDQLGGIFSVEVREHLVTFHHMAVDVNEVRSHIVRDPHRRPVVSEANSLLIKNAALLGAPPANALAHWRLQGKRHLCFWPHGPLHYVPFALLQPNGHPLADDWIVTTIANLASLGQAPGQKRPPHHVFAGTRTSHSAFQLSEQPALVDQVKLLASTIPGSELLCDDEVTPVTVLKAAQRASHLHIAAHGSHDAEAAWFQCLYLNPDPGNDGRLFAWQILETDLGGVDLVTLSACESAMGRYDLNDNLRGLPAAFLLAGAATVVGALWPVTADVAATFFQTLYGSLGAGKLQAFRTAQEATRRAHSAYRDWGAFSFLGSWQ